MPRLSRRLEQATAYPSTVLSPVLLMTIELSLDEKLEPLDLLPLLELLEEEPDTEMLGPPKATGPRLPARAAGWSPVRAMSTHYGLRPRTRS